MNILAIDTSQTDLGVALRLADGRLYVQVHRAGLRHAESLAPAVASLLSTGGIPARELGLVVSTLGPGSFTGVRIGMSTAKGLALGAGCGLVGVPSLDALAHRFSFYPGVVVPVTDAKKGRLYAALYRRGTRFSEYLDLEPDPLVRAVLETASAVLVVGPHATAFHALLAASCGAGTPPPDLDPLPTGTDPEALLSLGLARFRRQGPDPEPLQPLYLRPSEAEGAAGSP